MRGWPSDGAGFGTGGVTSAEEVGTHSRGDLLALIPPWGAAGQP